jgi:hypothetical protein
MEQSPSWEANRFVASQEIPRVLLNPKVHKCPPPVSILSQSNLVHILTSHFLKIHPNIILPSTPGSPQWFLYLRFPHQETLYTPLSFPIRATCPAYVIFNTEPLPTIKHMAREVTTTLILNRGKEEVNAGHHASATLDSLRTPLLAINCEARWVPELEKR